MRLLPLLPKCKLMGVQFMCSDMVLDPAALVWGQAKKGLPCDLKSEFRKIKREAEAVLDDLNK